MSTTGFVYTLGSEELVENILNRPIVQRREPELVQIEAPNNTDMVVFNNPFYGLGDVTYPVSIGDGCVPKRVHNEDNALHALASIFLLMVR